jgi:hypothetical protein
MEPVNVEPLDASQVLRHRLEKALQRLNVVHIGHLVSIGALVISWLILHATPESKWSMVTGWYFASMGAVIIFAFAEFVFWRKLLKAKIRFLVSQFRLTGNSYEVVELYKFFRFKATQDLGIFKSYFVYLPLLEAFAELDCEPPEPIRVQFEQLDRQWWNIYWQVKRRSRAQAKSVGD